MYIPENILVTLGVLCVMFGAFICSGCANTNVDTTALWTKEHCAHGSHDPSC